MTHFNHEWDTTKTPAVPVSVGDRYYAQDLNDDFNYLKHLPYEVFLQGRSRGVMVTPNDTWDYITNSLTLSGGFGVILQDCIELDPNEDFKIPPKTHSSLRYERIPFVDTVLILPNDSAVHYIVVTPTKRSLLQRTKALFAEQYASRVRYDGIITIQDTAPTTGQILIGLCRDMEYCLLIDINPDQCKDNIILKKWFGQNKIAQNLIPALQSYYNTSVASIETKITISAVNSASNGISGGTFNNCTINIGTVYGTGIFGDTFNNCTINIDTINNYNETYGISGGTFNNCTINIGTVNNDGISGGTFNNCTINIGTVNNDGNSINDGTFSNCIINIDRVNGVSSGINSGIFNNCNINIDIVYANKNDGAAGVSGGVFNSCTININTVDNANGGSATAGGVLNNMNVTLNLTKIQCPNMGSGSLPNTRGKLNVVNNVILHGN